MPSLAERLGAVQSRIADAAARAGRDPDAITTVVVTKFHPASLVRELHGLGVRHFGESRHQEAEPKVAGLADLTATWHFVGQVQSKKARQIARYSDVIHSVDRDSLLGPLAPSRVFLQVNLTPDPERGGVQPEGLVPLAQRAVEAGLTVLGVMAVAPLDAPARPAFVRVRELSDELVRALPDARAISMGMSGDFEDAIAEGATHLRIGTAITGNRPVKG